MKVFVEMPEDGMSYRCFAFFDTVTDTFDTWGGEQHWETADELADAVEEEGRSAGILPETTLRTVSRYKNLIPSKFFTTKGAR